MRLVLPHADVAAQDRLAIDDHLRSSYGDCVACNAHDALHMRTTRLSLEAKDDHAAPLRSLDLRDQLLVNGKRREHGVARSEALQWRVCARGKEDDKLALIRAPPANTGGGVHTNELLIMSRSVDVS